MSSFILLLFDDVSIFFRAILTSCANDRHQSSLRPIGSSSRTRPNQNGAVASRNSVVDLVNTNNSGGGAMAGEGGDADSLSSSSISSEDSIFNVMRRDPNDPRNVRRRIEFQERLQRQYSEDSDDESEQVEINEGARDTGRRNASSRRINCDLSQSSCRSGTASSNRNNLGRSRIGRSQISHSAQQNPAAVANNSGSVQHSTNNAAAQQNNATIANNSGSVQHSTNNAAAQQNNATVANNSGSVQHSTNNAAAQQNNATISNNSGSVQHSTNNAAAQQNNATIANNPGSTQPPRNNAGAQQNNAAVVNRNQPRRVPIRGFLNAGGTAIRSEDHAIALIGIIQLAKHSIGGFANTLSHNCKNEWFERNTQRFFVGRGPLSGFNEIRHLQVMRHFRKAQTFAKNIFDNNGHSNDNTGAQQESIPNWVRSFFSLFEFEQNQTSQNTNTVRTREERRTVATSLVGRQATLGQQSNEPAELRNETSANEGDPEMRQRTVGFVDRDTLRTSDIENRRRAPRRINRNTTRRTNVHINGLNFGADENDPSSRFDQIRGGYQTLSDMRREATLLMNAPQPPRDIGSIHSSPLKTCRDGLLNVSGILQC